MKKEILFSLLGMMMLSGYAKADTAKLAKSGHAATAPEKNKKEKGASGHDAQKGSKHH
jgi:hypothetical protein